MRVPLEAYKGLEAKRQKMEDRVASWTGLRRKITMANVLRVVAKSPVEISEGQVIRLVKKRKGLK